MSRDDGKSPTQKPCSFCGAMVFICRDRRKRWRQGQRQFYCSCACRSEYQRKNGPSNRMALGNPRFFQHIDSELKAYLLGYIYADGCVLWNEEEGVYALTFTCTDEYPLSLIKQGAGSDHVIHRRAGVSGKTNLHFRIGNKQMASDLMAHGVVPRKSMVLRFPTTVPDHLIRHVVRGYMDGDGDICLYREKGRMVLSCSFYGTPWFVKSAAEHVGRHAGLKSTGPFMQGTLCRFKRSQHQAERMLSYLYADSNYHLDRKKRKFDAWCELQQEKAHAV